MSRLFLIHLLIVFCGLAIGQDRYDEDEIIHLDQYIKANQYKLLAKYDKAIEIYDQLIEVSPLNAAVHHDMAQVYKVQKEYDKAIASVRKAVQYAPDNVWFKLTQVDILDAASKYTEAAKVLGKVAQSSVDQDLYRRWALAWDKASDSDKVLYVSQLAQAKFGSSTFWLDVDIDACLKKNDLSKATKILEKFLKNDQSSEAGLLRLVDLYMLNNQKSKSKELLQQILDDYPDSEEAQYKLAVLENQNKKENSISAIIEDTRLDIDYKIKTLIPVVSEAIESHDSEALTELLIYSESIVDQYPDNAKSYALKGDLLIGLNNYTEAIGAYEKSIELDKSIYDIWEQLMFAQMSIGAFEQLQQRSEQAIDFYPNLSDPYYYHAIALYESGDLIGSIEYIEEAEFIGVSDPFKSESLILVHAQIIYAQGDHKVAISELEESTESKEVSYRIYEVLGDMNAGIGQKDMALKYWNLALTKGANKTRVNQKLQSI